MRRVVVELRGDPAGRKVLVEAGRAVAFGRSNVIDVSVPLDPKLSAKHFSLSWDGQQCRLRDLGSHGGTWLHGARVG